MKFLHTADWQLGMVFRHAGAVAEKLRQARIDAVKNVLALAATERVEFIVAAGDLFEDNRIQREYVEQMARLVSASPVPIYLLPGNHDPLTHDSPYVRSPELFGPRVVVLREAVPVAVEGGTLFPCPALTRTAPDDPTRWIPGRDGAHGIRIGVAHGPIKGTPDHSCGWFIPADAAEALDLDYMALGHWHTPRRATDRMWHCGTPEPTAFGDDSGVLVVEVGAPGAVPTVRKIQVNTYTWVDFADFEIHGEADLRHLDEKLVAISNPLQTLVKVRMIGGVPQSLLGDVERLEARHSGRFFLMRVVNSVVPIAHSGTYSNPLLKEMSEALAAQVEAGPTDDDKEAARRALGKLALLARDCGLS